MSIALKRALANFVAQQVGGRGGGRADMAQAGGSDPSGLERAMGSVPNWIRENSRPEGNARIRSSILAGRGPHAGQETRMALIVQKYGGTSVGDLDRFERVAEKVRATLAAGHKVVVVVSAMVVRLIVCWIWRMLSTHIPAHANSTCCCRPANKSASRCCR